MKTKLRTVYHQTIQALKSQKKLLLPFGIFAAVESLVLTLIYLAPRVPFRAVLGPPIKAFRGEMFLHYPANFLIIPELSSFFRNILTVILGSLLAGTAAVMIRQAFWKKEASFIKSIGEAGRKYFQLFIIILITAVILNYAYKGVTFGITKYFTAGHKELLGFGFTIWRGPVTIVLSAVILLIVQAFFLYTVAFLMLGNQKLFKAIWQSFVFFGKHIWQTLLIVILPFLFYIPVIILQYKTAYLIDNVFPEVVLIIAYSGIIISSLIVDLFVTMSATLYYLNNKEG
ncbi:MAG: hypothetical protein WC547_10150 [Candidatus Omnitrophota bacterium]